MKTETRISVDVGGTFTDVVRLETSSGDIRFEKVPTTPAAPRQGVLHAFEKVGTSIAEVSMFNHGTTLGLNSLLTRTGARIDVIASPGLRDVNPPGWTASSVTYD